MPRNRTVTAEEAPVSGPQPDGALCAEYLLGLLAPAEARAFEARLATEAGLRARLALWADALAAVSAALPPEDPPPDHWAGLQAALFPEDNQRWWRRVGLVPALIAAAIAALLVLFVAGREAPAPDLSGPDLTLLAPRAADSAAGRA